jgi:PAS domain S-box-containing protein
MDDSSADSPARQGEYNLVKEFDLPQQIAFASGLFQGDATVRTLLESLVGGVVIINNTGIILLINENSARIFGYSRKEIIGKSISLLLPERFRGVHSAHIASFFAEPKIRPMGIGMDLSGRRSDGTEFPVEIGLSFIDTISGRFAMAFVNDITLRKSAEQIIRDRNKELEAFVYSVSHDLRNPLRTISGFNEILLEDYSEKLDFTGRDYLSRIYRSTKKMDRLIDDLLSLSRISRQEIIKTEVDLSTIATSIISELHQTQPEREVEISIGPEIKAYADSRLMEVALTNLLGNAWKFTGRTDHPKIEFGSNEQDSEIIYYVKDNGAGFNSKQGEKLFRPFQRLHTEAQFKGTGIGLAIVERVITRHGGRIWAESEEDNGASFFFTLPNKKSH